MHRQPTISRYVTNQEFRRKWSENLKETHFQEKIIHFVCKLTTDLSHLD